MKRLLAPLALVLALVCGRAEADIQNPPTRLAASANLTGSLTQVATSTTTVAVGSLVVGINYNAGATANHLAASSGFTDSEGNVFTCQTVSNPTTQGQQNCFSILTIQETGTTTFTATWNATNGAKGMVVEAMTGPGASPVGLLGTAVGFTTSSTPSIGPSSAITTPPNQMAFGIVGWAVSTGTVSGEASGWTTTGADASVANTLHLHVAYQFISTTGSTLTYNPTLSTTETGMVNFASYAAPGGAVAHSALSLLGVH